MIHVLRTHAYDLVVISGIVRARHLRQFEAGEFVVDSRFLSPLPPLVVSDGMLL